MTTTASTKAKSESTSDMPELAQKIREQLVSAVQQSQQLSVDAAQTWVKAASVLPVPNLSAIPGVPAMPSMQAATQYTFDLAADLLDAQRDFALQLAKVFVPETSA